MNIRRDTEYRFGELVLSPEYSNEQGVVVMIKSLATGLTMKVYLDEPTLNVDGGINYIDYRGHFYEDEFMVTPSEGLEVTGLPLMYPYFNGKPSNSTTIVIDVENHYYSQRKNTDGTDPINFASFPFGVTLRDFQDDLMEVTSGNVVTYTFTIYAASEYPLTPIDPGEHVAPIEDGTVHAT